MGWGGYLGVGEGGVSLGCGFRVGWTVGMIWASRIL